MKEIYEIRCMNYEHDTSKSVCAYADKGVAINRVKELNAKYYDYGEPYFMRIKTIDDKNEVH